MIVAAGRTLSINCIGRWWGTVPESEWPEGYVT